MKQSAVGGRDFTQHVGRDPAWADAVHVDVVRRERGGQDPRHVDQRSLAGAVGKRLLCPFLPASEATLTIAPRAPEAIIDLLVRHRDEWKQIVAKGSRLGYRWARLLDPTRTPVGQGVSHVPA